MSLAVPKRCANSACGETAVRQIHCSSQSVAIDSVDGAAVFAHHITYRCPQCGHTWAVQGYSSSEIVRPAEAEGVEANGSRTSSRGW